MRRVISRVIEVVLPARHRTNGVAIVFTGLVQIDPTRVERLGNLDCGIALIGQVLDDTRRVARELAASEGGHQDGSRARGADFLDELAEVGGILCQTDVGCGFLVVVAELRDCLVLRGHGAPGKPFSPES